MYMNVQEDSRSTAPEYLPVPPGYQARVDHLTDQYGGPVTAAWMAASEALGAVGRRETNHRDLFWHGEVDQEQRDAWDRIAEREGARFYFHQEKDTLVGYLACTRQKHRASLEASDSLLTRNRAQREQLRTEIEEMGARKTVVLAALTAYGNGELTAEQALVRVAAALAT